jgi:hypothetical protein
MSTFDVATSSFTEKELDKTVDGPQPNVDAVANTKAVPTANRIQILQPEVWALYEPKRNIRTT